MIGKSSSQYVHMLQSMLTLNLSQLAIVYSYCKEIAYSYKVPEVMGAMNLMMWLRSFFHMVQTTKHLLIRALEKCCLSCHWRWRQW